MPIYFRGYEGLTLASEDYDRVLLCCRFAGAEQPVVAFHTRQ